MLERYSDKMRARSATLLVSLEGRLDRILQFWLVVAGLIAAARIYFSPPPTGGAPVATFASYMLVVVAPFASTLLALRWFKDGHLQPQPATRLARAGKWRTLTRVRGAARPALRHDRNHGLPDGRHDAQRSGARGRVFHGDAADPCCRRRAGCRRSTSR